MGRRKSLVNSPKSKALSERMREVRVDLFGEHGGSELARQLGLPVRTWYNYEEGVVVPAEILIRFFEQTGVEPTWLIHGLGPKYRVDLDLTRNEETLESFDGFVDRVEGDTAYVRLRSQQHGDLLYGKYSVSQLRERGIQEAGRFLCRTVKAYGKTRVDISAISAIPVTDEQLRAVEEKIDRIIPSDDPGIEY